MREMTWFLPEEEETYHDCGDDRSTMHAGKRPCDCTCRTCNLPITEHYPEPFICIECGQELEEDDTVWLVDNDGNDNCYCVGCCPNEG